MEIFKLFGSILIDSAEAEKSISKTGEQAEKTGSKLAKGMETAAKWGAAVVSAAVAVGGAMVAAAKDTAKTLDEIDKGSQRMKISAESYQELAYAANLSGVEMSTLENAAKKLEGTGQDLDSALESIMGYATAEERAAAAAELFGDRVAYQLTPMLNAGAEGMAAARQEARDLGLVMSDETVAAGASMNDMFTKVGESIKTLKTGLVAELMPYVQEILEWVIENIPAIKETISSIMAAILPIIKTVLDFVMTALPPLFDLIKKLLDWIMPYLEPILDAIGTLLEALFALLEGDTDKFAEYIVEALSSLGEALFKIGEDVLNAFWDGLKSVWENIKSWFSGALDWLGIQGQKKQPFALGGVSGSHAAGLPYVPYDGYVAELHKGETVMNAGQSQNMVEDIVNGIRDKVSDGVQTVIIPIYWDGAEVARLQYNHNEDEGVRRGPSLVKGGYVTA